MDSSSNDSADEDEDEKQIDEDEEESLEDDAITCLPPFLLLIIHTVICQEKHDLAQWCKSFSVPCRVENRFDVSCVQLVKDGLLAYHGGTLSMHEHLRITTCHDGYCSAYADHAVILRCLFGIISTC